LQIERVPRIPFVSPLRVKNAQQARVLAQPYLKAPGECLQKASQRRTRRQPHAAITAICAALPRFRFARPQVY
jgi:hypothetical protein